LRINVLFFLLFCLQPPHSLGALLCVGENFVFVSQTPIFVFKSPPPPQWGAPNKPPPPPTNCGAFPNPCPEDRLNGRHWRKWKSWVPAAGPSGQKCSWAPETCGRSWIVKNWPLGMCFPGPLNLFGLNSSKYPYLSKALLRTLQTLRFDFMIRCSL